MTTEVKSPPAPLYERGENPAATLEAVFRHIAATRMADVSILTTNGRVRDAYSGKIHKAIGGKVRVDKGKVYLFEKI